MLALSGNKQLTDEEFVTFDGANVSPDERESDLIDESIEVCFLKKIFPFINIVELNKIFNI